MKNIIVEIMLHHTWNAFQFSSLIFFSVCQKEPMHINRGVNSKKKIFSLEEKSIDNSNLLAYEQVLIISPYDRGVSKERESRLVKRIFEATNNNSKRKPNY